MTPDLLTDRLDDPRNKPDFLPHYYPKANGAAPPPLTATGQNDRMVLQFLAAYYFLNCEYAALLGIRQQPPSPQRQEMEREQLRSIEKILIARDRLEDHFAPRGVIVEPVVKDGFAVDLKISFGNVDAAGRVRSDLYTITAFVPVPLPKPARFEDLVVRIEGPGLTPG